MNVVTDTREWQHLYSRGLLLVLGRVVSCTRVHTIRKCDVALNQYRMYALPVILATFQPEVNT